MLSLSAEQQCFYVAILAFIVVGFQRGWRRELVSLVFVLLAFFLIKPTTSTQVGNFLVLLGSVLSYLLSGGKNAVTQTQAPNFLGGTVGSLIIFVLVIALGYYLGNRVFPRPSQPHERFIGIVPAVISGAFIIYYLTNYFPKNAAGQPAVSLNLNSLSPTNFIPIIFAISIVALVVALIAARSKKAAPKK